MKTEDTRDTRKTHYKPQDQSPKNQEEIIPASLAPAFPTMVPPANDVAGMMPVDVTRPGTAAPGCAAK